MTDFYERFASREKVAFWGALAAGARTALPGAARAAGSFLGGAGRGLAGMELAAGAGRAAQAGRTTAQIAQGATTAKGIYDTVKPPEPPPPPPGVKPGMKIGSVEARLARVVLSKMASGWHTPVELFGYGAFALPHAAQLLPDGPVKQTLTSPGAKTLANTVGLASLGAATADSLRHGDDLAAYDAVGLGTMGAGVLHDYLRQRAQGSAPAPNP